MGGKGSGGLRKGALPREKNPAVQGSAPNVDPEQNHRVIEYAKDLVRMGRCDLGEPEAVEERFIEYLDMCDRRGMRPLVSGLAMAMGMGRNDLRDVCLGDEVVARRFGVTPESRDILQKSYRFLEVLYENYLSEERGNPVKWIFLAKNNFGYKDQVENVVRHVDDSPRLESPEQIAARYAKKFGRVVAELDDSGVVYELPDDSD